MFLINVDRGAVDRMPPNFAVLEILHNLAVSIFFLADRETQRTRRATPPQISAQARAMRPVGPGIRRPIQAAPLGGLHHTTSQPDLIRGRETTLPDPTQIVLPLRSVLDCVPLVSVSHREHTTTLEIRIAQA